MGLQATRTYSVLAVSERTFEEIKEKLQSAGYEHAFEQTAERGTMIDMHGIALCMQGAAGPGGVGLRAETIK